MYKQIADPLRRNFLVLKEPVSHLKPLGSPSDPCWTTQQVPGSELPCFRQMFLRVCSGDKFTAIVYPFICFPFFISSLPCLSWLSGLSPGSAPTLWNIPPSVAPSLGLTMNMHWAVGGGGTAGFKCSEYKTWIISPKMTPKSLPALSICSLWLNYFWNFCHFYSVFPSSVLGDMAFPAPMFLQFDPICFLSYRKFSKAG